MKVAVTPAGRRYHYPRKDKDSGALLGKTVCGIPIGGGTFVTAYDYQIPAVLELDECEHCWKHRKWHGYEG